MIIPAAVSKIVGFKKTIDGELFAVPTVDANIMSIQIDTGEVINIKILSNDSELNSLHDFLHSKANSVMKESEVKQAVLSLTYDDNDTYGPEIEREKDLLTSEGSTLTGKQLERESYSRAAKTIVYNKRLIKQKSIIRFAIATSTEGYTSKSVIVEKNQDGEKIYSRKGLSYFAQAGNNIPVELTAIHNSDHEYIGYFKVSLSNIVNLEQISFLLKHSARTIRHSILAGKKPFMLKVLFQGNNIPFAQEMSNIIRNDKVQQKSEVYERYESLLYSLDELLTDDPKLCRFVKMELPMLLTTQNIEGLLNTVSAQEGKSPLQKLPESIPALNFSSENPDIKNAVKAMVSEYLQEIASGSNNARLLTTMNFQALDILGESSTWGFPANNISGGKLVLSFNDTKNLIERSEELAKLIKHQFN
jgi:hypothetical protein